MQVLPHVFNPFEVRRTDEAFKFDIYRRTHSCRLCHLNGYGCVYSIACVCFHIRYVETYIENMFNTIYYMKSYNNKIGGMNGSAIWPETSYIPPLSPYAKWMPGRPTTKIKKYVVQNQTRHTISKVTKRGKYNICKELGHNKSTCRKRRPKTLNPRKNKRKICVNQDTG